jgi:peroxin-5
MPIPQETAQAVRTSMSWVTHEKITELFLDLTRKHHAEGRMDEDLQIALGVLFYNVAEYTRAHDCFAAALSARPKVRNFLVQYWHTHNAGILLNRRITVSGIG